HILVQGGTGTPTCASGAGCAAAAVCVRVGHSRPWGYRPAIAMRCAGTDVVVLVQASALQSGRSDAFSRYRRKRVWRSGPFISVIRMDQTGTYFWCGCMPCHQAPWYILSLPRCSIRTERVLSYRLKSAPVGIQHLCRRSCECAPFYQDVSRAANP
ncbi:hypothetical protein FA95DRAFT_1559911, partial [Auriscalpium vulgare]